MDPCCWNSSHHIDGWYFSFLKTTIINLRHSSSIRLIYSVGACRFEGVRGFYKGITPNLLKNVPAASITFIVYENVLKLLKMARRKDWISFCSRFLLDSLLQAYSLLWSGGENEEIKSFGRCSSLSKLFFPRSKDLVVMEFQDTWIAGMLWRKLHGM